MSQKWTISRRHLAAMVRADRADVAGIKYRRPESDADCLRLLKALSEENLGCPFVSCRLNMYCEVNESGGLVLHWPDRDPLEVPTLQSCAWIAGLLEGEHVLEEIGVCLGGASRERARQVLDSAQESFREAWYDAGHDDPDL